MQDFLHVFKQANVDGALAASVFHSSAISIMQLKKYFIDIIKLRYAYENHHHDLAWNKTNGLIPAIIQDARTAQVLMLGYMNEAALQKTLKQNKSLFLVVLKMPSGQKGRPQEIP